MRRPGVERMPALVVILMVAVIGASEASARDAATRVIDRTVVCQMPGVGYPDPSRFMTFSAVNGRAAVVSASNGPNFEARASITTGPLGRHRTGYVVLNREVCSASRARPALAGSGLRGGPVTGFGRTFECDVPTRVLIRVHARFRRPTAFSRDRESPTLIRARGRILTASLVVATLAGTPIAFASADGSSGKTRAFVAPSRCARTR